MCITVTATASHIISKLLLWKLFPEFPHYPKLLLAPGKSLAPKEPMKSLQTGTAAFLFFLFFFWSNNFIEQKQPHIRINTKCSIMHVHKTPHKRHCSENI